MARVWAVPRLLASKTLSPLNRQNCGGLVVGRRKNREEEYTLGLWLSAGRSNEN